MVSTFKVFKLQANKIELTLTNKSNSTGGGKYELGKSTGDIRCRCTVFITNA